MAIAFPLHVLCASTLRSCSTLEVVSLSGTALRVVWYAPRVARDGLPPGWEQPIPDSIWPEALISAVRFDVTVLATPRVIETIRAWRETARRGVDPRTVREAKDRLRALSLALTSEESSSFRAADFDLEGVVTSVSYTHLTLPTKRIV